MSGSGEANRNAGGKRSAQEADGLAIVHCTPSSSSSSSSMTRPRAVLAVQRPISSGSRHCVNVLKELLPQEAIQELHDQVATGAKALQAVEAVAQQRTRPQVAADVTKLFVSVSLASTAGSGMVTAAKGALCLLASPLRLRGPVRVLTNVLLPTPVAGSLLGCCMVLHTARELLAADSSNEHKRQQQEQPAAGQHSTAAPDGSSSSAAVPDAAAGAAAAAAGKRKRQSKHWWVFWQRQKEARKQGAAGGDAPAEQQQEADKAGTGHAAAAASEELHEACMELSPAGPVTPQPLPVAPHQSSSAAPADAGAAAAAAAVMAAASAAAFTSKGPRPGPASHALSDPSLRDLQCCGTLSSNSNSNSSRGAGCMDPDAASSAAADPAPHGGSSSTSGGGQQQGTGAPAPLPLSPTHSGWSGADMGTAPCPETCTSSSPPLADTPSPSSMQLRRRSSSGPGDCRDNSRSFTGGEPLSPTSSGPHSPREASLEIEGQAAALHRGWSLGQHDHMIPHPQSFQLLQSQPYRPPVFTRLSSGRGGCRITAAAAAAAAREQHAAAQQARQRERAAAAAAAAAGQGALRRYHSLDLRRAEQGAAAPVGVVPQQEQGAAGTWAGTKTGTGAGVIPSGEVAAPAGCVEGEEPCASLPPLPGGGAKEGAAHEQQQQEEQQQEEQQLQQEEQLLQQVGRGFVRQRSLDWGHKLCKTDAM